MNPMFVSGFIYFSTFLDLTHSRRKGLSLQHTFLQRSEFARPINISLAPS